MSIYRIQKNKDNPYVMVNKKLSTSKTISWKAKGIILYLLSLPDNWQVYESEITKHATDGIRSTRSGIKELISAGYIQRHQKRSDNAHFAGFEYIVHEQPQTSLKSTVITKQQNAKQHTTNNNNLNNKKKYIKKKKIHNIQDLRKDQFRRPDDIDNYLANTNQTPIAEIINRI